MKTHLENSVRKLTGDNSFSLSDKDVESFQKLVKGITFEAGTFEMAVAFIAIAIYDKASFIVVRNTREADLPLIADAFVYAYRNFGEEPMENMIGRRLSMTGSLADAVTMSEEFTCAIELVTPKTN